MVGVLKTVLAYGLLFGLGTAGVIWARMAALRPDPEVEQLLNSPRAVTKATEQLVGSVGDAGKGKSPLVAAAEAPRQPVEEPSRTVIGDRRPLPRPLRDRGSGGSTGWTRDA